MISLDLRAPSCLPALMIRNEIKYRFATAHKTTELSQFSPPGLSGCSAKRKSFMSVSIRDG